jgi:predicted nuclease of restriction endonuclease-like (RecB) superfamily
MVILIKFVCFYTPINFRLNPHFQANAFKIQSTMLNLSALQSALQMLDQHFKIEAGKSVNQLMTIRNWLYGLYIVEFQQNGADRAAYGERLLQELAKHLKTPGFSLSNLKLYRQFYLTYPQLAGPILSFLQANPFKQAMIEQLQLFENKKLVPKRPLATQFNPLDILISQISQPLADQLGAPPEKILSHLSFSHLTYLLSCEKPLQRAFYEIESIRGAWSKRELKRHIESLLFERTGLTKDKEELLRGIHQKGKKIQALDYFRDPYIFEFLGLSEPFLGKESELKQALLNHLQTFLLELGNGFCFEARQKRILIGEDWHFVDLVFYHRILKCHVLIDLKTESFKPAFAGNMNAYLNCFKEEIKASGDQAPIGLVLCTSKNEAAVL